MVTTAEPPASSITTTTESPAPPAPARPKPRPPAGPLHIPVPGKQTTKHAAAMVDLLTLHLGTRAAAVAFARAFAGCIIPVPSLEAVEELAAREPVVQPRRPAALRGRPGPPPMHCRHPRLSRRVLVVRV